MQMQQGTDQPPRMIPGSLIVQGRNPRTHFDPVEQAELEASIGVKGVIQSILVRPIEGGKFEIIAGERRWRGSCKVKGPDHPIPALVREMTDEEADEAALIENTHRAQMSPAEEAESAAKVLGQCAGNRDEAANRLGWDRSVLDKRLALMNCSENVRKALTERKILTGHAEFLAAVPKEKQDAVLERLLSTQPQPSPADLKAMLNQIARSLESAIFDKADCTACQFNSAQQKAMFSDSLEAGNCTNADCYEGKTESTLVAKAESMKDEFPVVRIVRTGENYTLLPVKADGATGVGEEQAKACRACQNFGAAISAVPGKLGNVYPSLCFDAACNSKKVAERIKAEKAATEKPAAPAKKEGAAAKGKAAPAAKAKVEVQDSTRVKEYRVKVWRAALRYELMANPAKNLIALIAISSSGDANQIAASKMRDAFEKLSGKKVDSFDVGAIATALEESGEEVITKMHQGIVATATASIEEKKLVQLLAWLNVDLVSHWKLCKEYLELLTKTEIEAIAEEIGLKEAVGEKFAKLMGSKKDEIITALLAVEGFDYTGKIPAQLRWVP